MTKYLLLSLLITASIHCVLIKLDVFKLADKYIFLLHEQHIDVPSEDMQQVTSIQSALTLRLQQNGAPLHISVEVPSRLNASENFYQYRKVTRTIIPIVKELEHIKQGITAEDIEVRSAEIVASHVISTPKSLLDLATYKNWTESVGNQSWPMGTITFKDLVYELYILKQLAQKSITIPGIDQSILDVIREEKYKTIQQEEALLHALFFQYKLKADMLVLHVAKKLTSQKKEELSSCMLNLFSDLFDLHCLHKICEKDGRDKALIVGGKHVAWVGSVLEKLGATHIVSHDPGFISQEHLFALADYRSTNTTIS